MLSLQSRWFVLYFFLVYNMYACVQNLPGEICPPKVCYFSSFQEQKIWLLYIFFLPKVIQEPKESTLTFKPELPKYRYSIIKEEEEKNILLSTSYCFTIFLRRAFIGNRQWYRLRRVMWLLFLLFTSFCIHSDIFLSCDFGPVDLQSDRLCQVFML